MPTNAYTRRVEIGSFYVYGLRCASCWQYVGLEDAKKIMEEKNTQLLVDWVIQTADYVHGTWIFILAVLWGCVRLELRPSPNNTYLQLPPRAAGTLYVSKCHAVNMEWLLWPGMNFLEDAYGKEMGILE